VHARASERVGSNEHFCIQVTEHAEKKMILGWVVDGEKTPRWAAGGIDPLRPSGREKGECAEQNAHNRPH